MDEIDTTNRLTEACKIFMSSEPFLTELECQAFFNHHVAFPSLHYVEISSQGKYLVQENEQIRNQVPKIDQKKLVPKIPSKVDTRCHSPAGL